MSAHHGILIHLIFSTKYRKPLLKSDWRDNLLAYIGGTIRDHKATLLKPGGVEDHIHLLIKFHPQHAISSTIQLLKSNSSKWINDHSKTKQKFSWQTGYGAFSVSQSQVETVNSYIENQEQHHKTRSFREEYLEILNRHQIDVDPKYIFETEIIG